jgi:hypothetical protein
MQNHASCALYRVWVESVQTDERLQSCKTIDTFIIRASYAISRRVLDYGFVLLEAIGLSAACRQVLSGRDSPVHSCATINLRHLRRNWPP